MLFESILKMQELNYQEQLMSLLSECID